MLGVLSAPRPSKDVRYCALKGQAHYLFTTLRHRDGATGENVLRLCLLTHVALSQDKKSTFYKATASFNYYNREDRHSTIRLRVLPSSRAHHAAIIG